MTDTAWMGTAPCQGLTHLFFPEEGEDQRQAKAVCAACPHRQACLEYALDHDERGIWGGTSERERRSIRRRTGRLRPPSVLPSTAGCGTTAAYRRHVRNCEPVDDACREAHALYNQQWEAKRRDRAWLDNELGAIA